MTSAADRRRTILSAISNAATLAMREPSGVKLIAVSKGRSPELIEALISAGQLEFGENRIQETLTKWPSMLAQHPDVRLHAIGQIQSNKAAEAVALFNVI